MVASQTSHQMIPTTTNKKINRSALISLARLALLCTICHYFCQPIVIKNVEAGGKGKVPIYMPIPIPIPVPAGPPQGGGGGGKFAHHQQQSNHHHQQHHQFDDDEGEVKKIYLLQPVQKPQPQPQLKGGGFMGGPVQTHIHMPAPQVIAHHQQQQQRPRHRPIKQQPASYEVDERPPPPPPPQVNNKHQHQQSELKILPIVVIPPIAPMPPIQLPPTNQAQAPRMTLTPQFNNYVVTANDRGGYKKPHRMSSGGSGAHSPLQDHKSFSDYNFAATSSANYRDSQSRARPRMRGRQTRPGKANAEPGYGPQFGASRSARFRPAPFIDEDSMDDYDQSARHTGQSSRVVSRYVGANRRRQQFEPQEAANLRPRVSGRDQMAEQQATMFDDEPSSMAEPARDSHPISREQQRNIARRFRQFIDGSEMGLMNANSDQSRDVAPANQVDRDYDDQSTTGYGPVSRQATYTNEGGFDERTGRLASNAGQQQLMDQNSAQDQEAPPSDNHRVQSNNQRGDLSSVYYESSDHSGNNYQNDGPSAPRDRRLHSAGGEREIFEDDEWRFDTIKSVAHSDPKANQTSASTVGPKLEVNPQTRSAISPLAANATRPSLD